MSAGSSALLSAVRQQSSALNLRPLQRIDPLTQSVVFTGKHSVLYRLDRHSEQWERDNVEGPFFIVQRSASPVYQLVILNRLGLDAWLLPLHSDTRFELQEDHYLFIQSAADVVGVWFFERSDAQQAAHTLQQLTHAAPQSLHSLHPHHTASTADSAADPSRSADTAADSSAALTSSAPSGSSNSRVSEQQQSFRAHQPVVVPSGKRLHSQPPPPPTLSLSEAVDGASEAQLQRRLKSFLSAFAAEDDAYSAAHREARSQQSASTAEDRQKATGTRAVADGHLPLPHNGVSVPLQAIFPSATAREFSQPRTPSVADANGALTAAELEKSFAAERGAHHSQATSDDTTDAALHPLLSQLFQHSADTMQLQSSLHRSTALQVRPALPSSLSSPSLLSHSSPQTQLPPASAVSSATLQLVPASLVAMPPLAVGLLSPALPHASQSALRLTLPPLAGGLSRAVFTRLLHDALSDERTVDDLYRQYARQQQPQQQHAVDDNT